MNKERLTYQRIARKSKDGASGYVYIHGFDGGAQQLIFRTKDAANKFLKHRHRRQEELQMSVTVIYDDNTQRKTTVADLRHFFRDETEEWQIAFFNQLLATKKALTRFAEYRIN